MPDGGLASIDRERLTKLCGMFGSNHAGERANAAAAADRLVRQAGLTWHDIVQPALPPPASNPDIEGADDAIKFCARHCNVYSSPLTEWERKFIASLAVQCRRTLSKKQTAVLMRLVEKCRRHSAGGRA